MNVNNPDIIIFTGILGLAAGFLFLFIFLYHRIQRLTGKKNRKTIKAPGLIGSIRNLVLILLWAAVFATLLFSGLFMQAYLAFTYEKPVGEIRIEPTGQPQTSRIILIQYFKDNSALRQTYLVSGDQWVLEGDILKWENWLNFLGLETRYRLTRIRGRYFTAKDEIQKSQTVYSLVEKEEHPLWGFLYQYGARLPFVNTVYGNAVFQNTERDKEFLIFVDDSGLIVREKIK